MKTVNPLADLYKYDSVSDRGKELDEIYKRLNLVKVETVMISTDCQIHGKMDFHVGPEHAHETECQKCKWERKHYQQKMREQSNEMLNTLKIPVEHINASFHQWELISNPVRQKSIVQNLHQYAKSYGKNSPNLLLTGNTGTGKTKLACLVANEIIRQRYTPIMSVAFKRSSQIQEEIKATWDRSNKDTADNYIEQLGRFTVLIIDEVGESDLGVTATSAKADRERLSAIIDRRYQLGLPTILTSNMTESQFYAHVGDRASDRLRQRMRSIKCDWISYRLLKRDNENW